MPAFHYWVSGSALFLAVSFAFGLAVGFIGIKDMVSMKLFYVLLVAGLVLTAWAWYSAAGDAEESADLKSSLQTIAMAIHATPNTSVRELANEILRRLPTKDWRLTDEQKSRLGAVLDSVPVTDRLTVEIHVVASDNASRSFGDELLTIFKQHHWDANGTVDFTLRPDFSGVYVGVANGVTKNTAPKGAGVLSYVLHEAGIKYASMENGRLQNDQVEIDIGQKPTEWP